MTIFGVNSYIFKNYTWSSHKEYYLLVIRSDEYLQKYIRFQAMQTIELL